VSEEKKQKKTAFAHKPAYKKRLPHIGSLFPYIMPFPIHAFREGAGGGFSRGKAFSRLNCLTSPPPAFPCRGPSFLLCQKKRSKRRPHLHTNQHTKKGLPHIGSLFPYIMPFPIHAFREGAGGGFSRGKAFSRLNCLTSPPPAFPCREPSFLLCQKKRSKRRPHLHTNQHTKRDYRKPAVSFPT